MSPREFLETLGNDMAMRNTDWLAEQLELEVPLVLLDLRPSSQFKEGHIEGALQLSINNLPAEAGNLIPEKDSVVVLHCNGSIQSAMAVMYLRTEGYKNSYNLSGGYFSWVKNKRPVVKS